MSMISGLIKNLRELIGQSNNQEDSEKKSDNNTQQVYVPVRYNPSKNDKSKPEEVR
ncbi:hypothetical protein [Dyadobacter sp. CY312]|uniref:hypothetical protein n=1 Tax=Dyadobacter sp. CY312 TaxID=2907303 RepID=UPI001F1A8D5E|nr:hypothetical protein [Dyadobacter sp. CY312]MCE7043567.1 hypothetical protein [Dyadobacter sp. CY312]